MRWSRWVCLIGLVGGAAACGAGATPTVDAGADVARADVASGIDVAPGFDAEQGLDAPPGPDAPAQCPDMDDDGHGAFPCGDDCDDNDRRRYPGAREVCDGEGRDEDCNPCTVGEVSPGGVGGDSDQDEDGFPSNTCFNRITGESMPVCDAATSPDGGEPVARVRVNAAAREVRGADCNDRTRTRNPAVSERCDAESVDENCNGTANEGCECPTIDHPEVSRACVGTAGVCATGTQDCVDGRWGMCSISPTPETCNERDDDCNGMVDEGVLRTFYPDDDGDGFGTNDSSIAPVRACSAPPGFRPTNTDCNDARGDVHPGARELCDGTPLAPGADENCNGTPDEGCGCMLGGPPTPCCSGRGIQSCEETATGSQLSSCTVSPTVESCNNADDDCDGMVDEELTQGCYTGSAATSGVGACRGGTQTCSAGAFGACAGQVLPREELCNAVDDDCNGAVDDGAERSCPVRMNATSTCSSGACRLTCNTGFADCDGVASNGCERNLNSDAANCGRCGNVCPAPDGGTAGCTNGACGIGCSGSLTNCNGACVDLTGSCTRTGDLGTCPTTGSWVCAGTTRSCSAPAPSPQTTCWLDCDRDSFASTTTTRTCGACSAERAPATCTSGVWLGSNPGSNADCDDRSNTVHASQTCFVDSDGDGFCQRATVGTYQVLTTCTSGVCPSGSTANCRGVDCNDSNRYVTTDCAERCTTKGPFAHCCCLGCGQRDPYVNSFSTSDIAGTCPTGWGITTCATVAGPGGGGAMATGSSTQCSLTQTCVGCEGVTTSLRICCRPNATAR